MKSFFIFISLSACLFATSQSNLSVFNNSGQRFYVIMNGIKQNSMAQTNVSVSGIKDGGYSIKLIFEDGKTPDIDKNFFIDSPSDITTKVVFKKGKGKLQLVSMLPTSGALQNNSVTYRPNDTFIYSDQQAITTNQTNVAPINGNSSNQTVNTTTNSNPQNSNGNTQVNTTNTTITSGNSQSTSSNQNTTGNVNMNMGLNMNDPMNGNLNMNVNIGGMNVVQTNSSSTTTTTTTSSQTINGTTTHQSGSTTTQNNNGNVTVITSGIPTETVGTTTGNVNSSLNTNLINQNNSNNGYNGNKNCTKTLVDFNGFMKDLKSQSFEDDKMETINLDLQKTCLTHAQAYQIIESLTFEENRFEIAKFLYARTLDKQLSEKGMLPLFTFDSTKMDWRDFVRNYK